MKRLVLLAAAVVAAFTSLASAKAQEFAPLVQPETVSVSKLNLDKLTPELVSAQVAKLASSAIDYFVEDAEQAQELKETTPILNIFITQYHSTFVAPLQDAGVKNVYFIVEQAEDPEETLYPYVAIPTKNLTEAQLKDARNAMTSLNQQLNSALQYRFVRNGFLIAVIVPEALDVDEDDVKAYVKKRFTKFNTVEKAEFAEGFKAADADALLTTVSVAAKNEALVAKQLEQLEDLFALLDDAEEDAQELAQKTKDLVQFCSELNLKCADLVKFSVCDVNLDKLELVSRAYANSAADAKKYVSLVNDDLVGKFNELLDSVVAKVAEEIEDEDDAPVSKEEIEELIPVVKNLFTSLLKMNAEDDVVVWKMNGEFWTENKESVGKIVSVVTEKLAEINGELDFDEDEDEDDDEEIDLDAE